MYSHHPSCLAGPVSGGRAWWHERLLTLEADPRFRADLVARIRREIADGIYDSADKLEAALDEMLRRREL
jgi:hypothetical protein